MKNVFRTHSSSLPRSREDAEFWRIAKRKKPENTVFAMPQDMAATSIGHLSLRPLSRAQSGVWFAQMLDPHSPVYNVGEYLEILGPIDPRLFEIALRRLVAESDALHLRFVETDDGPRQYIGVDPDWLMPFIDVSAEADPRAAAEEWMHDDTARVADLTRGPLFGYALFRAATDRFFWYARYHHLCNDGFGFSLMAQRMAEVYSELVEGRTPETKSPGSWFDLLDEEEDYRLSAGYVHDHEYWREQLVKRPEPVTLSAKPPARSRAFIRCTDHLSRSVVDALRALGAAHEGGLPQVIMAASALYLCRLTGAWDLTLGIPVTARVGAKMRRTVGMVSNVLPLRLGIDPKDRWGDLLKQVSRRVRQMLGHQRYRAEDLRHDLGLHPEELGVYGTVINVMPFGYDLRFAGHPSRAYNLSLGPVDDLSIVAYDRQDGSGVRVDFDANPTNYTTEALASHHRRFFVLLARLAVAAADVPLQQLDILGPGERQMLLESFNATERLLSEATLPELFEAQVERDPQAMAVVLGEESLTYQELNARANRLAHHLIELGVGPESLVGIALERSLEMVVALLGVLKAGGAYLPLDPDYPQARLAYMLADAAPALVLSSDVLCARLSQTIKVLPLDAIETQAALSLAPAHNPSEAEWRAPLHSQHPAYVIYTSGSTGTPKGVVVTHAGIASLAGAQVERLGLSHESRVLQFASLNFDASLWELVMALTTGARLVLLREGTGSGPALREVLLGQQVTHATLPPVVLATLEEGEDLALESIVVAGDTCPGELVARWSRGRCMINAYGPTETTVCATMSAALCGSEAPPIGSPIWNTRVYVLDGGLEPVPVGVTGELYVAGAGLARGYLNRPEVTAERFVADPHAKEPGTRMYRTGDLARWRADGTLEFLGRADQQVKIRGFRIELGEIEAVLASLPAVGQAAVMAREDGPAGKQLVAYVVAARAEVPRTVPALHETAPVAADVRSRKMNEDENPPPYVGGYRVHGLDARPKLEVKATRYTLPTSEYPLPTVDVAALRDELSQRLPDYMVPSVFVLLEALPLTANGKLDRRALPAPERGSESYRAARTPVEEVLCGLFAEVLKLERVGIQDNFFALGGHSLLATRLVSRVRTTLGVELAIRTLFEAPTIAKLARCLREGKRARGPLVRQARPEWLPLSYAQQRLWFLHRLEGPSATYNIPIALRLEGDLEAVALEAALADVVARHESLRTIFPQAEGVSFQQILPAEQARPSFLMEEVAEATLASRLAEAASTGLELSREIPLRAWLWRLEPQRHILLVLVHHIAGDGWSLGPLLRDLAQAYAARRGGEAPAFAELAVQYADYTLWQRELLGQESNPESLLSQQLGFWRKALAGAPEELNLPAVRPRLPAMTYRGARLPVRLEPALHRRLRELAQASGASLFMVLQAGLAAVLSRLGAGPDIPIGSPVAGRAEPALENLVGLFVNTLVLRTDLSGDPSFSELVARVRSFDLEAYEHQDVPFEQVVEALQPVRSLARHPLFQVMLVLQNAPQAELALPGLAVSAEAVHLEVTKFDLTLGLDECLGPGGEPLGIEGGLEYSVDLFDRQRAQDMAERFVRLLAAAVATPDVPLHRLEILSPGERQMLLESFNATERLLPEATLPELFEAQVERDPQAMAVVLGEESLTYQELNARANRLAHHLIELGVGPESLVGIALERSLEMVVALLGILKAGGAYLPLDPDYPQARLAYMLADSGAALLLTTADRRQQFGESMVRILLLDRPLPALMVDCDAKAKDNPAPLVGTAHLAYVMYTSGSTGIPKGVAVSQRAVTRLVRNTDYVSLRPGDRIAQVTNTSFDAATFEIWGALLNGGVVVILTRETTLSPALFSAALKEQRIDTLFLTTALFNQIASEAPYAFRGLRALLFGGEAVDPHWVRRVLTYGAPRRLIHVYGPTENTTFSTWQRVQAVPDGASTVAIGRPIANSRCYVLDAGLEPVPVGVTGELHVAGAGLARGYLNRPGLTSEHFVANPHSKEPGTRMYRTGDLARWRADGTLEFVGRSDQQVKIRGFRIEPGEIEETLRQHAGVQEAIVLAREDTPGEKRLVAYAISRREAGPTAEELRKFLQTKLPDYLVPSAFVFLDRFPITPNGKVNRQALPVPNPALGCIPTGNSFTRPADKLELQLLNIWKGVLRFSRIGVTDNFFELGGHSLMAMRLVAAVEKVIGRSVPLAALFQAPTVEQMAHFLRKKESPTRWSLLVPMQVIGSRPPLFFLHGTLELAKYMDHDQPFYILQPQGKDGKALPSTIELMAAEYINEIRRVQPVGPYFLGGYSIGGLVAFETAQRLRQSGAEVPLLVLVDPTDPSHDKQTARGIKVSESSAPTFGAILSCLAGQLRNLARLGFRQWPACVAEGIKWRVERRLTQIKRSIYRYCLSHRIRVPLAWREFYWAADNRLVAGMYKPSVYPGSALLFGSRDRHADTLGAWKTLVAGGLQIEMVASDHLQILREPQVQAVAAHLNCYLCQAKGTEKANVESRVYQLSCSSNSGPVAFDSSLAASRLVNIDAAPNF